MRVQSLLISITYLIRVLEPMDGCEDNSGESSLRDKPLMGEGQVTVHLLVHLLFIHIYIVLFVFILIHLTLIMFLHAHAQDRFSICSLKATRKY